MPHEFYSDWLSVAAEEALHFSLLARHLHTLGYRYGSFKAHNSLWDMAHKTRTPVGQSNSPTSGRVKFLHP